MVLNSYMPVKLITGKGCVLLSGKELKKLGDRCLVVTGKTAAKRSGALDDCLTALNENKQEYAVYDNIGQNPQLSDCMAAAEKAIAFGADCVIGIGGGSALDAAKCIAVLAANPGMTREQLYAFDWASRPLNIAAIGTTAGTGSEVTKVAVITTPDGRKKSFHHEFIFPSVSFGDASYTMSLPEKITRSTAVDVLAHCAESYFSRAANHISRLYAAEGIRLLVPVFRRFIETGYDDISFDERETLYCASIFGGLAINVTGTAFPHTMGYLLTEKYNIPHGTACAVFQKEFYAYNKRVEPQLAARFLEEIRCCEEEYLNIIDAITPSYDVEMTEDIVAAAHSRWIGNGSIAKCLGEFTADMADEILRKKFVR